MKGSREDWARLLPLLQAFARGEPVQHMGYSGRWADTESITSLLSCSHAYRLKPPSSSMGVWRRKFRFKEPGSVTGPVGEGVMVWPGADTDTPKWSTGHGIEYLGEAEFTPDAAVEQPS